MAEKRTFKISYKILSKCLQPTSYLDFGSRLMWYLELTDIISSALKVIVNWIKDFIELLTMTVAVKIADTTLIKYFSINSLY